MLTAGTSLLKAQSDDHKGLLWSSLHGLNYEFKAGVNIGGTSPLPLPKEIRSLDSYSPGLAITLEGNATKWIDARQKWGNKPRHTPRQQGYEYTCHGQELRHGYLQRSRRKGRRTLDGRCQNEGENVVSHHPRAGQLQNRRPLESGSRPLFLIPDGRRFLGRSLRRTSAYARCNRKPYRF